MSQLMKFVFRKITSSQHDRQKISGAIAVSFKQLPYFCLYGHIFLGVSAKNEKYIVNLPRLYNER